MDLLELTDEQKQRALAQYDKMLFPDLTRYVFDDSTLDGRSMQGKSLRAFLIGKGFDVTTSKVEKKGDFILTEEQKTFMDNNYSQTTKMAEVMKTLFPGRTIGPLNSEWKAFAKYAKEINPSNIDATDEPVEERAYKAPRTIVHVVARVNIYVTDRQYDAKNLRPTEERNMKMLMSYLSTVGFIYQASQYVRQVDRSLFEGSFIRYTYDKSDLTAEEIDRFSDLCAKIVSSKQIDRMLSLMSAQAEDYLTGDNAEQRKLGMTTVESMNVWRLRLEGNQKATEALYQELTESRAERIKGKESKGATFLNLLEGWKDPEKRGKMLEIAEKEMAKDMAEYDRLATLDDMVFFAGGMSREDMEH